MIISYHIIWCRIISYRIISWLYHIISYHMISYLVTLYYIIPYSVRTCHSRILIDAISSYSFSIWLIFLSDAHKIFHMLQKSIHLFPLYVLNDSIFIYFYLNLFLCQIISVLLSECSEKKLVWWIASLSKCFMCSWRASGWAGRREL